MVSWTYWHYHKFIQRYDKVCKPLIELLKKDSFNWSSATTKAFENLKQKMVQAPLLALPDFSKKF